MKYIAYKLAFPAGVHFGDGLLNHSKTTFNADTLFSALCIEATKMGGEVLENLYSSAKEGRILISDGMPYVGERLYIPKPLMTFERDESDISKRKVWKKLDYIPIEQLDEYLDGTLDGEKILEEIEELGKYEVRQHVNLQNPEKPEPYSVGVYHFKKGNGLYVLIGFQNEDDQYMIEDLLDALGFQGIGGKVSSGLGKYSLLPQEIDSKLEERLNCEKGKFVLLTTALPKDEELNDVIENANFLVEKRSGFVQSNTYSKELVKKKDMFFLKAGAVMDVRFEGDIYDVSKKGKHPIWRYGKPVMLEVTKE